MHTMQRILQLLQASGMREETSRRATSCQVVYEIGEGRVQPDRIRRRRRGASSPDSARQLPSGSRRDGSRTRRSASSFVAIREEGARDDGKERFELAVTARADGTGNRPGLDAVVRRCTSHRVRDQGASWGLPYLQENQEQSWLQDACRAHQ